MYIYQIEISNACSLTCSYCPHPKQVRRKGLMSPETFVKCVRLYQRCENREPLCLHNFGEPLLHPHLASMIALATERGVECSFFTNGVRAPGRPFERSVWHDLADAGLRTVDFSAHDLSESEFRAIAEGIVEVRTVFDPEVRRLGTWAGQVGAQQRPDGRACLFELEQAFVVLWDGRVSTCCLDAEGQLENLWIDEVLESGRYDFAPIALCTSCNSMREHEDM